MLLALLAFAHAGKLADGWRGHPYGSAAWMEQAPSEGCMPNPEEGVKWRCLEKVGGVEVDVSYLVDLELGGVYTGIFLRCSGYTVCTTVLDTLGAAWGKPFSLEEYGQLPKRLWSDKSVIASWDYNQYSDTGTATVFDKVIYERIKAEKAKKAKAAAEEL